MEPERAAQNLTYPQKAKCKQLCDDDEAASSDDNNSHSPWPSDSFDVSIENVFMVYCYGYYTSALVDEDLDTLEGFST
ncbi:hypothetical protein JOB18_049347 [Solea senegalensis]|uniref:Uncharacterized protein n=1 Tax=Solea senegalensis TaxID=28829 RepID=A0AAV6SPU4_SOLSE|nr:hypothetical protein JOB18_049347 [Solea senegalensis]